MHQVVVHANQPAHKISRHIYGQFAEHLGRCIYEGIWVGPESSIPNTRGIRNDVVAALKKIRVPNIRWPGGCFADTYHWKDGIGPRESRPTIVNVYWGGTTENNHFGTHEFLDLCEMLECEPYICGNVGSGTVQEMAQWLEYLTMPGISPMADLRRKNGREAPWSIKFWAIGNENWGCGGNMTAQQYAWEFRRYQTYCRNYNKRRLYKVACGGGDEWNEILLREAGRFMDGLSIHHYSILDGWPPKGQATQFTLQEYFKILRAANELENIIRRTLAIMDRYDPEKRIGLVVDEWGTWYQVEPGTNPAWLYQQNTIRDALVAGLSFHIFHRYADRVHLANIAQMVNVLQAMILTDGPKMITTPTYHVFDLYQVHQDATYLPTDCQSSDYSLDSLPPLPQVTASASRDEQNRVHVSLCNLHHDQPAEVGIRVEGGSPNRVQGRILNGPALNAHNTFDQPNVVRPAAFTDFRLTGDELVLTMPAHSIVVLELS